MESSAGSPAEPVRVEVSGLSVYTHHGVTEAERELGQRLIVDVSLEVGDCGALASDRIEETVDYGAVARAVAETATERGYSTLERLCQVICERLVEGFDCASVTVRAAKPEPPLELAVEEVAVEVTHRREPG
jgi:dihydroneopterin aldolase